MDGYEAIDSPQKSRKWLWIVISSAAVVIAAAVALIVYFLFFHNAVPLLAVGRSLVNLNTEVEERFENTPFKALTMLPEILEDGTLTANFDYRTNFLGGIISADIDGTVRLSSNTVERDYALGADVNLYGEAIDLDVYLNRERLALRASVLDNRFYGITYDTFRKDIRVFGRLIFLDNETMDLLADIVDQINEIMNAEEIGDEHEFFENYTTVLTEFIRDVDVSSRRTRIESGGERVRCTEIKITITKDALLKLLNDLYNVFENDEIIREQLEATDNPLLQGMIGRTGTYDYLLREFRRFIRELERNYEGDIVLSFYTNSESRLLRFEIDADIIYDGNREENKVSFDFGSSIEDNWVFDFSAISDYGSNNIFASWDYEVHLENYRNTVHIAGDDIESITLISDWNKDNGDFELAYISRWDMGEITGVFKPADNSFRLLFDNVLPESSYSSLKIDIHAETGSQIERISYINIDRWGRELSGLLMRFILGGIFS